MILTEEQYLQHYGTPRHSGRYPWGSSGWGEGPQTDNQRNKSFSDIVKELRSEGMTDSEIAKGMGIKRSELQARLSIAKTAKRAADISQAERLQAKGMGFTAIGEKMNLPESTVRTLLAPGARLKAEQLHATSNALKARVDEAGFIDVGAGTEYHIGVSRSKVDASVAVLKEQGYVVHNIPVVRLSGDRKTQTKVLCRPGTTQKEAWQNRNNVQQFKKFTENDGTSFYGIHDPIKIDPKRVGVVYGSEGAKADGVIFVRRNVPDLSLGGKNYGQVRVAVGSNHYMKGMAVMKDDMPHGVDLLFHTGKDSTGNVLDVLKPNESDPGNPFGAIVRQIVDWVTGKERVTSALNIVGGTTADPDSGNVEGNWGRWSKTLSSQMLAKQKESLVKSQLNTTFEMHKDDYETAMALTNPVIKKKFLNILADTADYSAIHLQAAAMPSQGSAVILPIINIRPDEVYAPAFKNGEKVVLIRHPHAGPFEIPELTVNNRNAEARKLIGTDVTDAIGIHKDAAQRLSGADFDGDFVLVIPNNRKRITVQKALQGLDNFEPSRMYPGYPGMKVMKNTQVEMGMISNLITDMSQQGASEDEIVRAVRHSMVVIDAENKKLNYKQSELDNNIKQLKEKYQVGGASTLLSRARSRVYVPQREPRSMRRGGPVSSITGEKQWQETGKRGAKGQLLKTQTTRLAEASDAYSLVGIHPSPVERMYAEHSNKLKALANQARLEAIKIPAPKQSPSARRAYEPQVASLSSKLALAERNRPLERQAQLIANRNWQVIRNNNPNMEKKEEEKIKYQLQVAARRNTGAEKQRISIDPKEWDAIQAGAISASKLSSILTYTDNEQIRNYAMPKEHYLMTTAKTNRAMSMLAAGYTRAEVAAQLGVSLTTLDNATSGRKGE